MWLKTLKKSVALACALLMAAPSLGVVPAQAKMIATESVMEESALSGERAKLESYLAREDVQKELVLLGIDPAEAAERVASLTDEEVRQVVGRLDRLPAGEGAAGAIVGAIVLIFLVLLVTDLLGLTDVFPFVNKRAR